MSVSAWIVAVAIALALGEISLWLVFRRLKRKFQWIVTPADIAPAIDETLVAKHAAGGFHSELGWVRRPGDRGQDWTPAGIVGFEIDDRGSRLNPGFEGRSPRVAVFGDSFAFCRLVRDDETWPHHLACQLDVNVLNFGVGNYGLDQALLRLEHELPQLRCEVAIMCIVPETMARIHSYWKHYFEYGNVLAFKPRFTLTDGGLIHHPPAVRRPRDYHTYYEHLAEIQTLDSFYRSKFLRDLVGFPYSWSTLRRVQRHVPILWHLLANSLRGARDIGRKRAFDVVLRDNARVVAGLYANPPARDLFAALVQRFCQRSRAEGAEPVLIVVPQPVDLARRDRGYNDYGAWFATLSEHLTVVDVTDLFLTHRNRGDLYVEGTHGPHVSPSGNKLIAETLAPVLQPLLKPSGGEAEKAGTSAREQGAP